MTCGGKSAWYIYIMGVIVWREGISFGIQLFIRYERGRKIVSNLCVGLKKGILQKALPI
jgi:hypothetical protein